MKYWYVKCTSLGEGGGGTIWPEVLYLCGNLDGSSLKNFRPINPVKLNLLCCQKLQWQKWIQPRPPRIPPISSIASSTSTPGYWNFVMYPLGMTYTTSASIVVSGASNFTNIAVQKITSQMLLREKIASNFLPGGVHSSPYPIQRVIRMVTPRGFITQGHNQIKVHLSWYGLWENEVIYISVHEEASLHPRY